MQKKTREKGWRVLRRYRAEDRERLIKEQAQSGLTKKAFCEQQGVNLRTFKGWTTRRRSGEKAAFAEVAVCPRVDPEVEVLLPNGVRIGIGRPGTREDLVALILGVAGYRGEAT